MKIKKGKIEKYLDKEEMNSCIEIMGHNHKLYLNELNHALNFLTETKPIASLPLDHKTLSLLMVVMLYSIESKKRDWHLNTVIRPSLIKGSNQLLKALELYKKHPYNIEEIIIIGKGLNQLGIEEQSEEQTQTIRQLRELKDARPLTYSITGIESIMKIFDYINKNEEAFKELADRESISKAAHNTRVVKGKIEPYLLKKYSKVIYNYFRDHLPKEYRDRQIFIMGGMVAEKLGIMPTPSAKLKTQVKLDAFWESNFKKAVRAII